MHVVMKYNKQYNLYFGCIVVVFLCTQNHGAIPEHVLNIDIEILRFVRKDACFVVIIIAKLTYIKKNTDIINMRLQRTFFHVPPRSYIVLWKIVCNNRTVLPTVLRKVLSETSGQFILDASKYFKFFLLYCSFFPRSKSKFFFKLAFITFS